MKNPGVSKTGLYLKATLIVVAIAMTVVVLVERQMKSVESAQTDSTAEKVVPAAVPITVDMKPQPRATQADVSQLQGEVRELREILIELVEFQSRSGGDVDRLTGTDQLETTKQTSELVVNGADESNAALEEKLYNRKVLLDDILGAQEVDPLWAEETIGSIKSRFDSEELAGFKLVDTRCASTLCRVEVGLDPAMSREESLQRLSVHRSWDGATFVRTGSDGETELYFARAGHDLPDQ